MGKAHSRALQELRHLEVPLRPELVSISGRNRDALERARGLWGWAEAVTDWREQVADDRVGLFVNAGPNALHAEPTAAADLRRGFPGTSPSSIIANRIRRWTGFRPSRASGRARETITDIA